MGTKHQKTNNICIVLVFVKEKAKENNKMSVSNKHAY